MSRSIQHVSIIGGSLGGLATGIALKKAGIQVDIHEKSSSQMGDRGAGIVLQPEVMEFLKRHQIAEESEVCVHSLARQYYPKMGLPIVWIGAGNP